MKTLVKILIGTSLLLSAYANAHVSLVSSSPAAGEVVTESPKVITLSFAGEVRLAKMMLHAEDGSMYPLDHVMSMTPQATFEVPVKESLPIGSYKVGWTAMGSDGHKLTGNFSFSVRE
ncbi:copper resistance CopC family protein [Pseudidiomarina sp. CB1]|uniref:copper resistance CopC family protein n=1 Tax=Pseudidiomarina sp. CB1 TaxID=2972484 RepID=UPI002163A152|nr:copper resistance CopC family protein [Pseudidiomarina sp. CB1]